VKSLVVEVGKRVNARTVGRLDEQVQRSCKKFSENLKAAIFYSVPHAGGGEDFKQFFVYQSQRLNVVNKKQIAKSEQIAKSGILKSFEVFNRQMAELSVDFETAVDEKLIIYAFGEGRPVKSGVSFSSKSLSYNSDYQGGSV